MANEESTPTSDSIELQMSFRVPGRMPGVYAQHLFVQPGPHEIVLSFFEVIPPLIVPGQSQEENVKQLQETGLIAECVARIIVPSARFQGFANAIQQIAAQIKSESKDKSSDEVEAKADAE